MRDDETVADEAAEVVTVTEQSDNSAAMSDNGREKQAKKSKKKRRKSKTTHKLNSNQDIKARFASCKRCCYFLGSYISTHGEGELETAALDGNSDWLTLTWDQRTRNLVHKAFGVRLDVDFYHYEGCCVACCRQFVYEAGEEEGTVFRVQL